MDATEEGRAEGTHAATAERAEYEENRARVEVAHVSVQNCWRRGADRAAEILKASGFYDDNDVDWARMDAEGIDMFRPFGKFVGLSDVDDGVADDEEQPHPEGAGFSVQSGENDVRDIEASLEEHCTIERKQRTVMDTNNQPVSLEAACRAARSAKKKTTERTRRAAGVEKAPGRFEQDTELEESNDVLVAGADPLLFFFGSRSGGTSIALGIPESFTSNGTAGLAEIELSALNDPKSKVTLLVMNPRADTATVDTLVFWPSRTCGKVEIAGPLVRPLNPDLRRADDRLSFNIALELLQATMDLHFEAMDENQRGLIRESSLSYLPYIDETTSSPLFICAGTEGQREKRGAAGSSQSPKVTCIVCGQEWRASEMRQHMGFHLIHERQKVGATMPCGFCGQESAQFSSDLSQVSGCPVWLEKKQPKMVCRLVGMLDYRMGPASKVSKASPCTNRPMQCPLCPKRTPVVHWKMNMRAHYLRSHPGQIIPDSLVQQIDVSTEEFNLTRAFGSQRTYTSKAA